MESIITSCLSSASALNDASEITENVVNAYWDIKQKLFNALTLWQNCRTLEECSKSMIYPNELKNDIKNLNDILDSVWHKICDAGMN